MPNMTLRISTSGMEAAMRILDVRSNNIANASTNAFKKSRVSFSDVVANSSVSRPIAKGIGAMAGAIRQDFSQGSIIGTRRSLDMAIDGSGYFVLVERGTNLNGGRDAGVPYRYTRNGSFFLDRDGFIVDSRGRYLLGEGSPKLDRTGNEPLRVDFTGKPLATNDVQIKFQLDDRETTITSDLSEAGAFNRLDPTTYNQKVPFFVFDSLGEKHDGTLYLTKTRSRGPNSATSSWQPRIFIGDRELSPKDSNFLDFNANGQLLSNSYKQFEDFSVGNGSNPLALNFFLNATSQSSAPFSVSKTYQNGYPSGTVEQISVDEAGVINIVLNNGYQTEAGRVSLAVPRTEDTLTQLGEGLYAEPSASPRDNLFTGFPGEGIIGKVRGGAIESSNANLTEELIFLIEAQRSFQSNAKALETSSKLTESLLRN
jgi:flagellar hook protein FlgE